MDKEFENPLFPLDLNIFLEHIKISFGNILEKVKIKIILL